MSLEFNSSFYLAQYPDIADAGIDPQFHFENYGAAEGRAPNATLLPVAEGFDEQAYRDANQDVNAAIENGQLTSGYQHWVLYGRFEESRPEATFNDGTPVSEAPPASIDALFNAEEYLELNPDVAAAGIDAYEHFVNYGSAEGRAPNAAYAEVAANFDGQAYRDANPDIAAAIDGGANFTPYQHWVLYGQFEESRPEAVLTNGRTVSEALNPETTPSFSLTEALELGDELPEVYELTDATADLGALKVAEVAAAQANAQDIVGGAANADELTLEASYSIEDSAASLVEADAAVLEAATSVTVTDSTITLEQASALEGVVAELPPIGDTAENASGLTGLEDQAITITDLDNSNVWFAGHENATVIVNSDVTVGGNAYFGSATIDVQAGSTLTLTAAQATDLAQAGGSITGEGTVEVTDLDGNAIYDLSAIQASAIADGESETLREDTQLGSVALEVPAGTLTLSAEQATGREITGAGATTILVNEGGQYDFTGVETNTSSAEVSGEVTFAAGTKLGDVSVALQANAELTIDAATAHRKEITAAATAELNVVGSQNNANFSAIDVDAGVTVDLTGMTGSIAQLPANGVIEGTLNLTAAQATGKAISGNGTVNVTELSGLVDLSKITANTVNATASEDVTLGAGSKLGTASVALEDGATLTADGSAINGTAVTGDGTLVVTGTTQDVDLNGVATNLNIRNFTGTITGGTNEGYPSAIAAGNTLTLTAAQANAASAATINVNGDVVVRGLGSAEVDLASAFGAIGEDASLTAVVSGNTVALATATDVTGFDIQVPNATQTLTLSNAQVTQAGDITGNGNVVVTLAANENVDLSDIDVAGTATLRVTGNADLTDGGVTTVDFGDAAVVVVADKTLTLTAEQAADATVTGEGNVVVELGDDVDAVDLSGISLSGDGQLTLQVTNAAQDITGVDISNVDVINFSVNETLTLTADQLSGISVTGTGTVDVATSGTLADATDIASTVSLELANDVELTASTAVLNGLAVTAAASVDGNPQGTLTVTGAAIDGDLSKVATSLDITAVTGTAAEVQAALGTLSLTAGNTLTMTAAQAAGLDTENAPIWGSTDGTIVITGDASGLDFSAIDASLDLRGATVDADTQLPGSNQDTTDTALVAGQTLYLNADQLDILKAAANDQFIATNDTGTTGKLALSGTATDLDLSKVQVDLDVTDAELLASVETAGTVWPAASGVAGDLYANQTLTLTAAQASEQVLDAQEATSKIVITDLQDTLAADFSNIGNTGAAEGALTASFNGTGTFVGQLNGVAVTVAEDAVMTLSAARATSQSIDGAGSVVITGSQVDADLEDITAATVDLTGAALTGTTIQLPGAMAAAAPSSLTAALVDQTLIVTDVQAGDLADTASAVTGTGTSKLVVKNTDTEATVDLTGVEVNIDITDLSPDHVVGETTGTAASPTVIKLPALVGQTVEATATQVNGAAITGDADSSVVLSGEFSGLTLNLISIDASIDVSAVDTSSVIFFETDGASHNVGAGRSIALTAAQANNQLLVADQPTSVIVVKDLDQTLDANLAGLTGSTGTITAEFNTSGTFTGSLSDAIEVVVADDAVLTITAEEADLNTITSAEAEDGSVAGSVVITDLGEDAVDLSGIAVDTTQDKAGTVTTTVGAELELNAGTVLGNVAVTLANGAELTLTTSDQADGRTIEGNGKVIVAGGVSVASDVLTNITTDLDISAASGVPAELPGYHTNDAADADGVLTGQTLTLSAAQATAKAIEGTGNVVVEALGNSAADLSNIVVDGEMTVNVPATAILDSTTDLGSFDVVVAEGAKLTLTAAQADGISITGAGSVVITGDAKGTDLSGIQTDIDFQGSNAGGTDTVAATIFPTLTADQTVTGTAASMDGAIIDGEGTVNVTALQGEKAADLSGLTANTVTATLSAALELAGGDGFTGDLGQAVVDLNGFNFETAVPSTLDGVTVEGTGNVAITGYEGEAIDLSNIANDGDQTILIDNVDGELAADADLGGFALTIKNDSIFSMDVSAADGRIVEVQNAPGNGSDLTLTGSANGADLTGVTADAASTVNIRGVEGDVTLAETWATGTLALTAAQADGKLVNVTGNFWMSALQDTPTADLSNIIGSGDIIARFEETQYDSGAVNFSGQLSDDVKVNVVLGASFFVEADTVAGKQVMGDGTVSIVESTVTDGDFINISADLDLSKATLEGVTRLPGNGDLYDGQTLTIDVAEINNDTITSAGTSEVVAVGEITDGNFFGIETSLDLTQVTLSGSTILPNRQGDGSGDIAGNAVTQLADDQVLSLTAAQAAELVDGNFVTMSGTSGELALTGDLTGLDLRNIQSDLDLRDAQLGNAQLPGLVGNNVNLGNDQTLTLEADEVIGQIIQGAGDLQIAGELDGTLDLTTNDIGVAVSFVDNTATVADGGELTLDAANANNVTFEGAGSVTVEAADDAGDALARTVTLDDSVQATLQFADHNGSAKDNTLTITGANQDDVLDFSLIAASEDNGLSSTTFAQYVEGEAVDAGFLAIATDLVGGDADNAVDVATFFAEEGTGGLGRALNDDLAEDSQMIFALSDSAEANGGSQLWYWNDFAGNGDGIVDDTELTNIGTLTDINGAELAGLTADNVDLIA